MNGSRIAKRDCVRPLLCLVVVLTTLAMRCATPTMVPLLSAAGIPVTQTPRADIPLEVLTRSTGVRDPLPVDGSRFTYGDVETALGHAISSATVPWADVHKQRRPEGWQLSVEMIAADASYSDGRLIVTLGVRATLRTRVARTYLPKPRRTAASQGLFPPSGEPPFCSRAWSALVEISPVGSDRSSREPDVGGLDSRAADSLVTAIGP